MANLKTKTKTPKKKAAETDPAQLTPPASPKAETSTKPEVASTPQLTISISGDEGAVRRALSELTFTDESTSRFSPSIAGPPGTRFLRGPAIADDWDSGVTRQIAREQTNKPGTTLQHTLAGQFLKMFSPDDRLLYVQRCVGVADKRGHPVPDPSKIPSAEETTVMEVGDALFDNSAH